MTPRVDWGWFEADGKTPIAVGEDWHNWICPQRRWLPSGYEHNITGEWIDEGFALEGQCKAKESGFKREVCERCAKVFIYP